MFGKKTEVKIDINRLIDEVIANSLMSALGEQIVFEIERKCENAIAIATQRLSSVGGLEKCDASEVSDWNLTKTVEMRDVTSLMSPELIDGLEDIRRQIKSHNKAVQEANNA